MSINGRAAGMPEMHRPGTWITDAKSFTVPVCDANIELGPHQRVALLRDEKALLRRLQVQRKHK
jgi:hypothetical protein